jgi:Holliday junction resolvase-like predicted endonuclease
MTVARQSLGRDAEELVAARLASRGWRIVARNVRVADVRGELDLIAVDGDALVFAEVKARRSGWLRERGYDVPRHRDLRFDVIGLRLDAAGRVVEWEHFRAAF